MFPSLWSESLTAASALLRAALSGSSLNISVIIRGVTVALMLRNNPVYRKPSMTLKAAGWDAKDSDGSVILIPFMNERSWLSPAAMRADYVFVGSGGIGQINGGKGYGGCGGAARTTVAAVCDDAIQPL